jgi:hypothetical protein
MAICFPTPPRPPVTTNPFPAIFIAVREYQTNEWGAEDQVQATCNGNERHAAGRGPTPAPVRRQLAVGRFARHLSASILGHKLVSSRFECRYYCLIFVVLSSSMARCVAAQPHIVEASEPLLRLQCELGECKYSGPSRVDLRRVVLS